MNFSDCMRIALELDFELMIYFKSPLLILIPVWGHRDLSC